MTKPLKWTALICAIAWISWPTNSRAQDYGSNDSASIVIKPKQSWTNDKNTDYIAVPRPRMERIYVKLSTAQYAEKKARKVALKLKIYKTITLILPPAAFAAGVYIGLKLR